MRRYRGFSPILTVVPQKSQQGWSEIYPGYTGVLIVQSPHLLNTGLSSTKAKPHGCCIFSMILHEAPSMETTTPKGEWFPCWVAEWSIMENMQQQMWFCFYPSPISINISIYVYNALRLTPEIWFWAMPFASFQIDINKYFAIVSPRCQVISNCDVMSPWITWQNNRLMISRFTTFSREYLLQTALCNQ